MKKYYFLIGLLAIFFSSCESRCMQETRIDGYKYYSCFVYKFREGMDLSNNVMIMVRGNNVIYEHGYRPIPLHDGYYLDGPIRRATYVEPFYYLSFTYDDIENGTAPANWESHWRDYLIPCWVDGATYDPYENFCYYGYCECPDEPCGYRHQIPYNESITLHTPIMEDIHIDTNILNYKIDNNLLFGGLILY